MTVLAVDTPGALTFDAAPPTGKRSLPSDAAELALSGIAPKWSAALADSAGLVFGAVVPVEKRSLVSVGLTAVGVEPQSLIELPARGLSMKALAPSTGWEVRIVADPPTLEWRAFNNFIDIPIPGLLVIENSVIEQLPGALDINAEVSPNEVMAFSVGGIAIESLQAGPSGLLEATLDVPGSLPAGAHTLVATGPKHTLSAAFAIELAIDADPSIPPPDIEPFVAPEVSRWTLQDPMPGGLGTWEMPLNPVSMDPIPYSRNLTSAHTVHGGGSGQEGMWHISDTIPTALEWSFAGFCPNQDFYDRLTAYAALNRRFWLIDHRRRAWMVAFRDLEMVPRKRGRTTNGNLTDWRHDYTAHMVIYNRNPRQV